MFLQKRKFKLRKKIKSAVTISSHACSGRPVSITNHRVEFALKGSESAGPNEAV